MNKKVLVVEDDFDISEIIEIVLTQEQYAVFTSATGQDVVELINKHHPDVILLDIRLGNLDGMQICRYLKDEKICSNTPIILMSAHVVNADIIDETCADDFLPKPFDIDNLINKVNKAVNNNTR